MQVREEWCAAAVFIPARMAKSEISAVRIVCLTSFSAAPAESSTAGFHWYDRGKKSVVWRCISRLENTGLFCDVPTVPESQIEQILISTINQALCDKDTFLVTLQRNIETVLKSEKGQPLINVDKRLAELQEEQHEVLQPLYFAADRVFDKAGRKIMNKILNRNKI